MSWSYDPTNLDTTTASGQKVCNSCGKEKPLSSFHKNITAKDGLRSNCKECKNLSDSVYRQNNCEKKKESQGSYYKKNKGIFLSNNAKRRAKNRQATPKWLSPAQIAHIKRFYNISAFMQEVTGEIYHVDHIIPLNNEIVCGLHVPWNLRVIHAKDNLKKSNKFEE